MSSAKIAEAADLAFRLDRRCDDTFKTPADLRFEGRSHGVSGLANRDHEDAMVGIEVVQIVSDAEDAALAVDAAGKRGFYGSILKRGGEDIASGVAHPGELLQALGGEIRHARDYKGGL